MKRIILICLIAMLVFAAIEFPSTSAQSPSDSDAPYIYYYSDILNAFVIERADGTDSRTLGDGIIPEDTNTIAGPGWSPSGEWLAWTAAWVTGYGQISRGYKPAAVHVSDERHLTTLDDIQDARMVWHPTEDLLFLAGVTTDTDYADFDQENVHIRLSIIDPTTDSVVNSEEMERSAISWSYQEAVPLIQWVDANHAVAYYDEIVSQDPYEVRTIVHVVDRSGNSTTLSIPFASRTAGGWHPTVSPAGFVAYIESPDNEVVVFENVITGEKYYDGQGITDIWEMWWNNDGVSGTAYAVSSNCDEPPCTVESWAFTVEDGFVRPEPPLTSAVAHLASVAVQCDDLTHQFATWLTRAEGDNSVQIVNVYACSGYELTGQYELSEVIWDIDISPDGRYLSYVNEHIVVYDTQSMEQTVIAPDGRGFSSVGGGSTLWHDHLSWFITTESASIAGGGGGPHWIGVATPDGVVNRDLTLCGMLEPCIGWLPDRVDRSLLSEGQPTPIIPAPDYTIQGTNWTFYLSWSPDSQQLATLPSNYGREQTAIVYDVQTTEVVAMLEAVDVGQHIHWQLESDGTYSPVVIEQPPRTQTDTDEFTLAVCPDEHYAVVSVRSEGVLVIDLDTGITLFEVGTFTYPTAAFSPDSSHIAISGRFYQPVQVWNIPQGDLITTLNTNGTALAFSPDGQTLAVASSWDIQLWDVERLLFDANQRDE